MNFRNANEIQAKPAEVRRRSGLPPLDLLRSFDTAARTLSFTRAADELALTQSAVSRQIQQLEAALGVELFERRHRALALTEAGRIFHRTTADCLERLRDGVQKVRGTLQRRQVTVTSTPGFASLWLIPRLARFSSSHPAVDVRISATLELLDLETETVDIAVRFLPVRRGQGQRLFDESVFPVCAPTLTRQRTRPLRSPQDLVQHTLLAMEPVDAVSMSTDWLPWFELMGLPELSSQHTMRFSHYGDVITAAVAGQGVAIGRMPLIEEYLADGRLVAPFRGRTSSQRGYFVQMAPRALDNPDAMAFVDWLLAEAGATEL